MIREFVSRKLGDLLSQHRVVVWYDPARAFSNLHASLELTGTRIVDASSSELKARLEADVAFGSVGREGTESLLIYVPRDRGKEELEIHHDLFETYARMGASFGDRPSESLLGLAVAAMPERSEAIRQLFSQGSPALDVLELMARGSGAPRVKQALGTDNAIEATALLLCDSSARSALAAEEGAVPEFLELAREHFGFDPKPRLSNIESIARALGHFVLVSEFLHDLPAEAGSPGEDLLLFPHAPASLKEPVFKLCDRMRDAESLRDGYIERARRTEDDLKLPEKTHHLKALGLRDTFPFEERMYLSLLDDLVRDGKLEAAREVITRRKKSVWRQLPERAVLWTLAGRCVDFLEAIAECRPVTQDLVSWYASAGYKVDRLQRLFEQSAADCAEDDELQPLVQLCRGKYREVLSTMQNLFFESIQSGGWPPSNLPSQTAAFSRFVEPLLAERKRAAYFLVDAMRYEMGKNLADILRDLGEVSVRAVAGVLPATTPCGMAALMPAAEREFRLREEAGDLIPEVNGRKLAESPRRMEYVASLYRDRFAEFRLDDILAMTVKKLKSKLPAACDFLIVRSQEIDAFGESSNLYQARRLMSGILGELRTAVEKLSAAGFTDFVFAADHGHILLPEIAPGDVVQEPPGQWKKAKRRCRLGAAQAEAPGSIIFPVTRVGIQAEVPSFAVPRGVGVYTAGTGYFHEGLSLQENVIPIVTLSFRGSQEDQRGGETVRLTYRSDKFTSRVVGVKVLFSAMYATRLTLKLLAFDGGTASAKQVGESADCDARDPGTGLITLAKDVEVQVPIKIDEDFDGPSVEIRAIDVSGSGIVYARLKLKNGVME